MSELDVREGMTAVAAEAPAPPADLLGRVEAGRRRHRRRQAVTAAFAAVVVLAAGSWAVIRPAADRADTPVAPSGPFIIPSPGQDPPPVTTTWPGTLHGPRSSILPTGEAVRFLDQLDDRHLLMGGVELAKFYSYDAVAETFRVLVPDTGGMLPTSQHLVIRTPSWVVWIGAGTEPGNLSIFRAPITGGDRELVAVVPEKPADVSLYATDEYVYLVRHDDFMMRVSMADQKTTLIPGFEGMGVRDNGWAQQGPGRFRNVVNGEERLVTPPPDTPMWKCVPDFCVVRTAEAWFVQRLDGSDRTPLPWSGSINVAGGLIQLPDNSLLDPLTGKHGAIGPSPEDCTIGIDSIHGHVRFDSGCPGTQEVFVTPGD